MNLPTLCNISMVILNGASSTADKTFNIQILTLSRYSISLCNCYLNLLI